MQKVKILHILDELKYSGAEVMLKNSAHLFINQNIELHVLSTGSSVGEYSNKLAEVGFKIHYISFSKTLNFFFKIYSLIKKEKIEIIHIHPERAFFWYATVSKLSGATKIVRTVHSLYDFKGYLKIKRKLQRFVSSKFFKFIFISISPAVQKIEKRNFNNNTILIKNWINALILVPPQNIDEKTKARKNLGFSEEKVIIISIGNCSKIKNHVDIIKAIAELVKYLKNIIYLHVGEGESLTEEIHLAHDLKIDQYVKFFGKIDNVRDVLICSDIFVMTSLVEGSSVALLEAGSCGLPLVIYNTPGLKESVLERFNGLIVKPNYEDLIEGLKEFNHK